MRIDYVHPFSSAEVIRHWGALFDSAAAVQKSQQRMNFSWTPAELMATAALRDAARLQVRLRELVKLSNDTLSPLTDPLFTDLGLHRWLRKDREEAYSDWLQWVLQQLPAEMIVRSLGIDLDVCRVQRVNVRREVIVPQGRLDLLIEMGKDALLLVEVKRLASAEAADTDKHKGYCEWFNKQPQVHKPRPQLLVVKAENDDYKGFSPLLWSKFCVNLRRLLPEAFRLLGLAKASMVIAFIGAIETNILSLSTPFDAVPRPLLFGRTLDHLRQALRRKE